MKTLTSNRLSKVIAISLSLWVCFALYTCSNNRVQQLGRVRVVPPSNQTKCTFSNDSLFAMDFDSTDIFSHKLSSL